jgi:hypothetical protein
VIQTSDSGYLLGGTTGFDTQDYSILKLDANGSKIWEKTFGGSGDDTFTVLRPTADGGYILGGYSYSGVSGNKTSTNFGLSDYWIIKLDNNGEKVWEKTFGGGAQDSLFSVQQTKDGGYILAGQSASAVSGNRTNAHTYSFPDFWLVKLDSNGIKILEKSFGSDGPFCGMEATVDGGFILGGAYTADMVGPVKPGHGASEYYVVKLDADLNVVWGNSFGGTDLDLLSSVRQTRDGGYILGGSSWSGISGDKSSPRYDYFKSDYWIIKLDAAGNKMWDLDFGGDDEDVLGSVEQASDGGYLLAGYSSTGINGNKTCTNYGTWDYWVIKLEADPLGFWRPIFNNDTATLKWSSISNRSYRIQTTTRFGTNWQDSSVVVATNTTATTTISTSGQQQQFYRLLLLP